MQQGLAVQMLYYHKTQPIVPSAPTAILPHYSVVQMNYSNLTRISIILHQITLDKLPQYYIPQWKILLLTNINSYGLTYLANSIAYHRYSLGLLSDPVYVV